ncbi:helix-turn-helix domain-containing protein [Roseobacter sp. HKCCA0434]|uniref:helix-turn-helix domain-containing protein n=1 Tax=Roseobacter sp. HKCCA0434 TaxID=3079297 RepID=UPI002905E65E|nr:RodZ domain-containing protein [Roseobacter sp. HKCCA0434]
MAWDTDGTLSGFDSYEVTLGDRLRGERATKGKSLLDVQRELRIKASYIAAIENCDLEVFPNRGFVAGYVRSYARYLDLPQQEIYDAFCAATGFAGVNSDISGRPKGAGGKRVIALEIDHKNDPLSRARGGVAATGPSFDLGSLMGGAVSLAVMAALLGAVGYGGWMVLQEVQRVELAPVAQTPVVSDTDPALAGDTTAVASADVDLTRAARDEALQRLYRPEPLVPVIAPRDGPIAGIDPEQMSSFASYMRDDSLSAEATPAALDLATAEPEPVPMEAVDLLLAVELPPPPPTVSIVATQAAWVRVSQADGATLFEKILAAGESYDVPLGVEGPELRAGNSGSVFLRVGDAIFGPLGDGPRVAKNVSLNPADIPEQWQAAEPTAEQRAALDGAFEPAVERTAQVDP